jgi:hypothetical protein
MPNDAATSYDDERNKHEGKGKRLPEMLSVMPLSY